jgi:DNA replication and repair protein RecF
LIGGNDNKFQVYAEIHTDDGRSEKLGLERTANAWKARRNGESVQTLADLSPALPLVIIEPNSHNLVDGSPENRRRMVDWGVFHVKPEFLSNWQRYQRTLKQRNAQLKINDGNSDLLDGLDIQLARYGQAVSSYRNAYISDLIPKIKIILALLSNSTPDIEAVYKRGWSGPELLEYLQNQRNRDLEIGATAGGPHRADLLLTVAGEKARDRLSRGQQKLLAAALLLAQAQIMSDSGNTPVLLIDDLAAEFDSEHLDKMVELLASTTAQVWLTGVDKSLIEITKSSNLEPRVFHVKQGQATPA